MFEPNTLQSLLAPFGLDASTAEFIRYSQNHVYRCKRDDGSPVIIRISVDRELTQRQVEAELALVSHLADQGLPVCRPVPSREGRVVEAVELQGRLHLVSCIEHAPGRKIVAEDETPALIFRLGALTARLHDAAIDYAARHGDLPDRGEWHESRLLTRDIERYMPASATTFKDAMAAVIARIKAMPPLPQQYGLIHSDISFSNCFVDDGRLWIFDFDNLERVHFLQDTGATIYDTLYSWMIQRVSPEELETAVNERWRSYRDGYQSVRPFDPRLADTIGDFLIYREAVIYVHYQRVLDLKNQTPGVLAALEEMKTNVERGVPAVRIQCS